MKKLLLVLAFLIPACASAQYKPGMIMEDGVWKAPTPQMALDAIATNPNSGRESAVAVLRQTMDTRSAAELDALADKLGRLVREGTEDQWLHATIALELAAKEDYDEGIQYERAANVFIQAYESLEDHDYSRARQVLHSIMKSGGGDYIRKMFESSEPPEKPCWIAGHVVVVVLDGERPPDEERPYQKNAWCDAGDVLIRDSDDGPAREDVWPACFGSVKGAGQTGGSELFIRA